MTLTLMRPMSLTASMLVLSACASLSGPELQIAEIDVPDMVWSDDMASIMRSDAAPVATWWEGFSDPILTEMITTAIDGNLDVALATERIREARAIGSRDAAGLRPTVDLSGSVTGQRQSRNSTLPVGELPGFEADNVIFRAGFDANWELDIFGRGDVIETISDARIESAIEAQQDIAISVASEIAQNYINLRSAQAQIAVIENNLNRQSELVELTRTRRDYGEASDFDVERAELVLLEYQALLPDLDTLVQLSRLRMSVLLGNPPSETMSALDALQSLPAPPPVVSVGLTSDLLRRRPDLRRAEREYVLAAAQSQLTRLDTYPRFSLFGSGGPETIDLVDLFDVDSLALTLGGLLNWSLYDGGRDDADEAIASSSIRQAELSYRNALLISLEDVERAAAQYVGRGDALRQRASIQASYQRILEMSKARYEAGTGTLTDVLEAERDLADESIQLTQIKSEQLTHLIALYKALGGGWEAFDLALRQADTPIDH